MTTERYEITPEMQIVVETTLGDVRVSGHDASHVLVHAEKKARVEQEDDALRVRSEPGGSSDLKIEVPHTCKLSVRLASGNIRLEDVGGEIKVHSMSGDVDVRRASGRLRIHTVSGDTTLRAVQLAELSIETVSGDSTVEAPLATDGRYQMHSVSGNLRLGLAPGQACTVALTSLSGDLVCKLAHQATGKDWGAKRVVIGEGGPLFEVHTTSGDVRIASAEPFEPSQEAMPVAEVEAFQAEGQTVRLEPTESRASEASREPFALDSEGEAEAQSEMGSSAERRMAILKAIEEGRMAVSEGLAKLRGLD